MTKSLLTLSRQLCLATGDRCQHGSTALGPGFWSLIDAGSSLLRETFRLGRTLLVGKSLRTASMRRSNLGAMLGWKGLAGVEFRAGFPVRRQDLLSGVLLRHAGTHLVRPLEFAVAFADCLSGSSTKKVPTIGFLGSFALLLSPSPSGSAAAAILHVGQDAAVVERSTTENTNEQFFHAKSSSLVEIIDDDLYAWLKSGRPDGIDDIPLEPSVSVFQGREDSSAFTLPNIEWEVVDPWIKQEVNVKVGGHDSLQKSS